MQNWQRHTQRPADVAVGMVINIDLGGWNQMETTLRNYEQLSVSLSHKIPS